MQSCFQSVQALWTWTLRLQRMKLSFPESAAAASLTKQGTLALGDQTIGDYLRSELPLNVLISDYCLFISGQALFARSQPPQDLCTSGTDIPWGPPPMNCLTCERSEHWTTWHIWRTLHVIWKKNSSVFLYAFLFSSCSCIHVCTVTVELWFYLCAQLFVITSTLPPNPPAPPLPTQALKGKV